MSSLQTLYFFGTLPKAALKQIKYELDQAGWVQTNHPRDIQKGQALVTWTTALAPDDLLPEEELLPESPITTWFFGAQKETYYSSTAPANEALRARIRKILKSQDRPMYIMDDRGASGDDSVVHLTSVTTKCVIGPSRDNEQLVLIQLP